MLDTNKAKQLGYENANRRPIADWIHRICVDGRDFIHDVLSNRIFSLDSSESEVLERWLAGESLEALHDLFPREVEGIEALRNDGVLCFHPPEKLAFGIGWDEIAHNILHRRDSTVIELTQQCNMRCRYCTFGGGFEDHRIHSNRRMSTEMLLQVVDSALAHSDELPNLKLGFYGGEPLLAFETLATGVRYALEKGKTLRYSVTTNGTLIDERKARFLNETDATVLVSIDGPSSLHDLFRRSARGRPTHKRVSRGLRTLLDVYGPERRHKIGLNMVVPSLGWVPVLDELWKERPWLPRNLRAKFSLVNTPEGLELPLPPSEAATNKMAENWLRELHAGRRTSDKVGFRSIDDRMLRFHKRHRFTGGELHYFPNGCCIPGQHKVYVAANGTYEICERVHGVPSIGSLARGMDMDRIRQLIEEYNRQSFGDCQACSSVSNCGLCYKDAYGNGRFDIEKKRRACLDVKAGLRRDLSLYCSIGLYAPQTLDAWDWEELA